MSAKTEEPTPRRLRRARDEGDSGASAFAAQSVAFVVAVTLVPAAARSVVSRVGDDLRGAIATARDGGAAVERARSLDVEALATKVVALSFPLLLAVATACAILHVVQTGGLVTGKKLSPRLARLDPIAGLRGLFSTTHLFAAARALLGAAVVAWLAYRGITSHLVDIAHLGERAAYVAPLAAEIARGVARDAAVVGLALGVVDLVVMRGSWMKRLRMTKEEAKREQKEGDGDPHLRAARARAYGEMLASATVTNVRTASVVVVDEAHVAIALRYDATESGAVPLVVSSGEGDLALRIVAAARDYGVPVVTDVALSRALAELQIGDAIPEALYDAVADILKDG